MDAGERAPCDHECRERHQQANDGATRSPVGDAAGCLLVVWTVFELVFIPNGLSVFYVALGVLQLMACGYVRLQEVN